MAKVTAPLLSFGAKGKIADSVVFADWRGVKYARQYTKPANPRTTAQQANRTRFAMLREMYKLAPSTLKAPWEAFASGRPFLPANKFVGENNRLLNGQPDMSNFIGSPGARGGLPPEAVTAATGSGAGEIDVTVEIPDQLPDGWAVEAVAAAAFPDQDPAGIFDGPLRAGQVAAPGDTVTLTGLPNVECRCVGWVIYSKPTGELAYSVSLNDAATPTA